MTNQVRPDPVDLANTLKTDPSVIIYLQALHADDNVVLETWYNADEAERQKIISAVRAEIGIQDPIQWNGQLCA